MKYVTNSGTSEYYGRQFPPDRTISFHWNNIHVLLTLLCKIGGSQNVLWSTSLKTHGVSHDDIRASKQPPN